MDSQRSVHGPVHQTANRSIDVGFFGLHKEEITYGLKLDGVLNKRSSKAKSINGCKDSVQYYIITNWIDENENEKEKEKEKEDRKATYKSA